ncbi:MAG: zinc ribbon domain-containing protein [Defluviitaleaceae bacterium]|nr:zinc ribbon domain-containing protein [Defluviitaleaceae bacterium]
MDDIKKGIVNATRSIAKGSGTFLKTTKLSMTLSNEEANMKSLYIEIGKKVHEIYSYGGSLGDFFDKKYQEVLEQQKKIDDVREAMEIAKGVKTCPKCGKTSPRASTFCPKCGEAISDVPETVDARPFEAPVAPTPAPVAVVPEVPLPNSVVSPVAAPKPAPKGKICNVCGNENDPFDRFCLSCGRIL